MNRSMIANLMKPLTLGLIVALFFAIHWAIPSFYSTLWQLTVSHDIPGLTSYISSFGSIAVVLMILLIVLTNMTGLPSVQFVTVNGILFGLLPGIVISWAGQVLHRIVIRVAHNPNSSFLSRKSIGVMITGHSYPALEIVETVFGNATGFAICLQFHVKTASIP